MKKIYFVVAWIHLRSFGFDSLYYKWKKSKLVILCIWNQYFNIPFWKSHGRITKTSWSLITHVSPCCVCVCSSSTWQVWPGPGWEQPGGAASPPPRPAGSRRARTESGSLPPCPGCAGVCTQGKYLIGAKNICVHHLSRYSSHHTDLSRGCMGWSMMRSLQKY